MYGARPIFGTVRNRGRSQFYMMAQEKGTTQTKERFTPVATTIRKEKEGTSVIQLDRKLGFGSALSLLTFVHWHWQPQCQWDVQPSTIAGMLICVSLYAAGSFS